MKRLLICCGLILCSLGLFIFYKHGRSIWAPVYQKVHGSKSVPEVITDISPSKKESLDRIIQKRFDGLPESLIILAFKKEKQLELWGQNGSELHYLKSWPVLAASGTSGPKLREGDRQVPEGIYNIEYLNPNSSYHLSMKINYPNAADWQQARIDQRQYPGTNIFIHGKAASIGCIAIGDEAIEELFYTVHKVGSKNVQVLICPYDFRKGLDYQIEANEKRAWVKRRYAKLKKATAPFRR